MTMKTVHDLLTTCLSYALDFELQIAKAAPGMASASTSADLKDAFEKTETKSKHYAAAVEKTFGTLGVPVKHSENHIASAMVRETQGIVEETQAGAVRDAALIVAANKQQLFRVASYGSMLAYADLIGNREAVTAMRETLEDSKEGDKKFTAIAEGGVNRQAAMAA